MEECKRSTPHIIAVTDSMIADQDDFGLPPAWEEGIANGSIPSSYDPILKRFLLAVEDHDLGEGGQFGGDKMEEFIEELADGFQREPRLRVPELLEDDADTAALRRNMSRAAMRLHHDFKGLLPASLWETYAYPAKMQNPAEKRSILEDANRLPNAWWVHDILLHAPAKVFSFMLHVQSTFSEIAGVVIDHECGCSDCIRPDDDKGPRLFLRPEERAMAAQAVFEHILAEAYLVMYCGMPFSFATEPALLQKVL